MIKVGIAGYGIVGQRRHEVIDRSGRASVVAVCDKKFDHDGVLESGVKYFPSLIELLSEPIDVLFVCMTNDANASATIAGLRRGLHVFCEKPPGRTSKEVMDVMSFERTVPNLVLMYGFNHRYHHSVMDAYNLIRGGELGRVVNMRGVYGKSQIKTFDQTDWRTKHSIAGGGVLLDQGIHMLDLMRLFAGDFIEVKSYVENSFWNYDVEDNAYAIMRTEEGVVAVIHSSATQWRHKFHLEITLQKGTLLLEGLLTGSKSYGEETLLIAKVGHGRTNGQPEENVRHYSSDPSWRLEIAAFFNAIESNITAEHGTSEDALKTMLLVENIYAADSNWFRDEGGLQN